MNWQLLSPSSFISYLFAFLLGWVLIVAMPLFQSHPIMIGGFLGGMVYLCFMAIAPAAALAVLIVLRASLDSSLAGTRIAEGGMGIGAGLNLVIIILTVFLLFKEGLKFFPKSLGWGWAIFLVLMGAAVVYSPNAAKGARLWVNLVTYFCMLVLPFLVARDQKQQVFWWKTLLFALIVPVLGANWDALRGGRFYADAGQRVLGTFTHPNILAFFLVWGVILVTYVLLTNKIVLNRWTRFGLRALLVNLLVLLMLTKTRNAWIALWIAFFLWGCWKDKRIMFLCLLLPPLGLLVPSVRERVMDLFASDRVRTYQGENSWEWRWNLWQSSFAWIMRNPVVGYGLASFLPLSVEFFNTKSGVGAHNVYVELLFETGFLGLVSFVALFLMILKQLFLFPRIESDRNQKGLALIIVYVISSMLIYFADNLLHYLAFNWYFWFFIGLVLVERPQPDSRNLSTP